MSNIIHDLESRFLHLLRTAGQSLAPQFPQWKIDAGYSNSFGTATNTPGHSMGISCLLPGSDPDQPDEVVLEILVGDVQARPTIQADVIWGYPGQLEMQLFQESVPVSEETLDIVEQRFPELVEALAVALRREKPVQKTVP